MSSAFSRVQAKLDLRSIVAHSNRFVHMPMLPLQFYLSLALIFAGLGMLQFRVIALRKMSVVCFWLASGGLAWALTQNGWLGVLALLAWIVLPMSEMVLVLRRLRLPRYRSLSSASPPFEEFPDLRAITNEIEALGFRKVDDCKLTPANQEQYYRLFVHPSEPIHAFIGLISNGAIGFQFVAFSSEDRSGDQWVTWDYPLSYGLVLPPQLMLHRALQVENATQLFEEHREFLSLNGLKDFDLLPTPDAAAVRAQIEKTMSSQLEYNWSIGILSPETEAADSFRYSLRGFIFVVTQVVRDFVRM